MFSCEYSDIFKNTFFYRLPLVAASLSIPVQANDSSDVEIKITESDVGCSYEKTARNRYFIMSLLTTFLQEHRNFCTY